MPRQQDAEKMLCGNSGPDELSPETSGACTSRDEDAIVSSRVSAELTIDGCLGDEHAYPP